MTKCYVTSMIDEHLAREAMLEADQEWEDSVWDEFVEDKTDNLMKCGFLLIDHMKFTVSDITGLYVADCNKQEEENNAIWFAAKGEPELLQELIQDAVAHAFSKEEVIKRARLEHEG